MSRAVALVAVSILRPTTRPASSATSRTRSVISYSSIAGQVTAAVPAGEPAADVTIQGFAFGSGKLSVTPGKAVTWVNADDSPHQVTVTGLPRSNLLAKG